MTHIAFFEQSYSDRAPHDWALRGGYKYPSLLGDLPQRVRVTLLMSRLPPPDDPHRLALEKGKVRFREFGSTDDHRIASAEELAGEVSRYLERLGATIVSTLTGRMLNYNYALARAAATRGIRYVYRVAGNDIETRGHVFEAAGRPFWGTAHHAGLAAQERYAIDVAACVIAMSQHEAIRLRRLGAGDKVRVCLRGVDLDSFHPVSQPARECRRFLFVGRQSHEKGHDKLEAAAAALAQTLPDLRFSFAGTFAPRRDGNRDYLGFVEQADLPALYRRHDALVVPARSEGLPQVIVEAMSCGLACILSASLFGDDFSHGEDAFLVGQDWRDVVTGVQMLAQDLSLFARLRAGAVARATGFGEGVNRAGYHLALLGEAT